MAKRSLEWTQNKYERFLKEGRGQGVGKEYKPWLTIQDIPSRGRVSRIYGIKTQRIHHFFSDIETRMFYLLHWEDCVVDIREHYPILDVEKVIKNKSNLDFNKYVDKESGTPYVFTTTFLITVKKADGSEGYIARSVKTSTELEKKHIIESFEIQRRYWEARNISWGITTQKEINSIKAKNIEWVYTTLTDAQERGLEEEAKFQLSYQLREILIDNPSPIRNVIKAFDHEYHLDPGTGLYLLKYLIATKSVKVDMEKKIDINASAKENFEIVNEKEARRYGAVDH